MPMYPIIPSKEYGYGSPDQEPIQDDEEAQKKAAIAEALANGNQDENTPAAPLSDQEKLSATLEALAPKKYTINPDLANYLTQMRAGKDEAAAQERKQNSLFQAFDAVGQARANEWGGKYSPIGDTGDSAQKAAVAAEGAVNAANLKDIQGHIDRRGEIARALASKRGNNVRVDRKMAGIDPVSEQNVYTDTDSEGNKTLVYADGTPATNGAVNPSVYSIKERNKIVTPAQTDEITALDDVIKQTDKIAAQKSGQDTGPISSFLNEKAQKYGIDDAKVSAFRAMVGDNLADYIKSKTGATASNQERAFLEANTPNFGDNDATFNAKMVNLRNKLSEMRETRMKNLENAGKDVTKFRASNPSTQAPQSSGATGSWGDNQPTPAQPKETLNTLKNGRKAYFNTDTKEFIRYAD